MHKLLNYFLLGCKLSLMSKGFQIKPGPLSLAISARVRAVAGEKRVKQIELSRATAISPSQISELLSDKKGFDIEQLDRVCFALGLNMTRLIADAEKATGSRHAETDAVALKV